MDVAAFGEEVAFVNIILFELVGDTFAAARLVLRFFALCKMWGGLTARRDRAPAHDFLDHSAQDRQLRGVSGFRHTVAAHAVEFFLQLSLPFRVQAHG